MHLNGLQSQNDHVLGTIFLKCEAGLLSEDSPTWLMMRAMFACETLFGTGAIMSGAVSRSSQALLVTARVTPVQVVRTYWGFATPERKLRELMILFWKSFW